MAMQSLPTASLIAIQATFLLGIFVKLFDNPTRMGQQDEAFQRLILRGGDKWNENLKEYVGKPKPGGGSILSAGRASSSST